MDIKIAISYGRISTGKQFAGRGLARQDDGAQNWCDRNGYTLDTSFVDDGMSAFRGKNATEGALKRIMDLAEAGTWKPGTLLIVELLDRLSRQDMDAASEQMRRILRTGLDILTLMDNQFYTLERWTKDLGARITSLVIMSRANEELETKSKRLKDVWQARRADMRAGKGKATNACPEWLTAIDGEFHKVPERVAVIEQIIADRHLGLGKHAIATRLNTTVPPVPAFRGPNGWHPSMVEKLVKSVALRGLYQPCFADGRADGDPIEGHYPRIISDDDWWRAQWPKNGDHAPRGRKTKGLNNLLAEACHCGHPGCGAGLVYVNKGTDNGGAYLVCSKARRGLCGNKSHHRYPELELELLAALSLFDFSRLIDHANPQAETIAALEAEIADITATVDRLLDDFSASTPASVSKRIAMLEAKKDGLTPKLDEAKRAAQIAEATESRDAYAEFKAMVDSLSAMPEGEERYRLRTRIAGELRRLIDSATAVGSELTITLRGSAFYRIELIVNRAIVTSLRLTAIESGNSYLFPRDVLFGDGDLAGLFAGYVGTRTALVAAA